MGLDQSLSHRTHLRIKAFLSGVFSYAKQSGALTGVNAMDDTKVGGEKKKFQGVAYSLDTIKDMLERLPEPARTVCATAAFTGLSAKPASRITLAGLRRRDIDRQPEGMAHARRAAQDRRTIWRSPCDSSFEEDSGRV